MSWGREKESRERYVLVLWGGRERREGGWELPTRIWCASLGSHHPVSGAREPHAGDQDHTCITGSVSFSIFKWINTIKCFPFLPLSGLRLSSNMKITFTVAGGWRQPSIHPQVDRWTTCALSAAHSSKGSSDLQKWLQMANFMLYIFYQILKIPPNDVTDIGKTTVLHLASQKELVGPRREGA